jgi:hypothetical protein
VSKVTTYHNIIAIIPAGIVTVLSYTLASILFSAWMVQYMLLKDQDTQYGLIESFRKLAYNSTFKDTRKKMLLLFLVTLVTSILLNNFRSFKYSNYSYLRCFTFIPIPICDLKRSRFTLCTFLSNMSIFNYTTRLDLLIS